MATVITFIRMINSFQNRHETSIKCGPIPSSINFGYTVLFEDISGKQKSRSQCDIGPSF